MLNHRRWRLFGSPATRLAVSTICIVLSVFLDAPAVAVEGQVCTTIDFENYEKYELPTTLTRGLLTIDFASNWMAVVGIEDGGSDTFKNTPSGITALRPVQTIPVIKFSPPVRSVKLKYSHHLLAYPFELSGYRAFDPHGLLKPNSMAMGMVEATQSGCTFPDIDIFYCNWGEISIASTQNSIAVVDLVGSYPFFIDDLEVCYYPDLGWGSGASTAAVLDELTFSDTCPPHSHPPDRCKGDPLHPDCLLWKIATDAEQELSVWCQADWWYGLFFKEKGGEPELVGVCPFECGLNIAKMFTTGDKDANGVIDAIIKTVWESIDGDSLMPGLPCMDDNSNGLVDWRKYVYDALNDKLSSFAFASPHGPGYDEEATLVFSTDPPLGPETRAFFDQELAGLPPRNSNTVMSQSPHETCDLNHDGVCDVNDEAVWFGSWGSIAGASAFRPIADADGDGIVTENDRWYLFPTAITGSNQETECRGPGTYSFTVDGSESGDPVHRGLSYQWSAPDSCTVHDPGSSSTQIDCPRGWWTADLSVSDGRMWSDPEVVGLVIDDNWPAFGGISFPVLGGCYAGPVTVTDNFTDLCYPDLIERWYSPEGGPTYSAHGDYSMTLRVVDGPGQHATDACTAFTIDRIPPTVSMLGNPSRLVLGSRIPFSSIFTAHDDDGAWGDVRHEVAFWDGCPVFDGLTYGNKDGLLSDEVLTADTQTFCDAVERCNLGGLVNPVVEVRATDCAANVGTAFRVLPMTPKVAGNACHTFLAVTQASKTSKLEWSPVLRADSYDLLRGNVVNLRIVGGAVDLGPVKCLGRNVPLTTVRDDDLPGPGHAFFYLTRFRRDGAVSEYGWASTDEVRQAGSDDCPR